MLSQSVIQMFKYLEQSLSWSMVAVRVAKHFKRASFEHSAYKGNGVITMLSKRADVRVFAAIEAILDTPTYGKSKQNLGFSVPPDMAKVPV